ncbi:MAG: hypothetical protein LCH52_03830 [Bacteroidetes bacterium]|nr:hypothetical protein [Bacteroidota bacterium]
MTPRQGLTGRNVDVRKGNDATSIDRNLGYAMEFNGSDEYLQIALPLNILNASANDLYSVGSAIAGWTDDGINWAGTTTGKTYTNTIIISADKGTSKTISGLIVGQKYKFKIRYQAGEDGLTFGSGLGTYFVLPDTLGEWNTVSKIFTAESTLIVFDAPASGACIIDYISVKFDQGFDLNRDQEQILHSNNWNFNGSTTNWTGSGAYSASLSTVDKYEGSGSLLISGSISGSSITNHVKLTSANIESCVSGKKYTLEGFARLDATTLTYASDLVGGVDFTSASWVGTDVSVTKVDANSLSITTSNNGVYRAYLTVGKIYKVVTSGTVSGSIKLMEGGNILKTYPTNFSETFYFVATATTFNVRSAVAGTTTLDDFTLTLQQADMVNLTAQLGTKSVTSSALSIVAGTFTKFVLNFEATSAEVSQDLKLYLSGAGSAYVDKLSLTQRYDRVIIKKFKATSLATSTIIIQDGQNYVETRVEGKVRLNIGDGVNTAFENTQVSYSANEWTNICSLVNSTDKMYIIKNGVVPTGVSVTSVGKFIDNVTELTPFRIAANTSAGEKFTGQISLLQIIRFENISQSTFNNSIVGVQYPVGGGTEEILRLTFQDGTSILNCLRDYSPKSQTVTAVNIDISNRKKVS